MGCQPRELMAIRTGLEPAAPPTNSSRDRVRGYAPGHRPGRLTPVGQGHRCTTHSVSHNLPVSPPTSQSRQVGSASLGVHGRWPVQHSLSGLWRTVPPLQMEDVRPTPQGVPDVPCPRPPSINTLDSHTSLLRILALHLGPTQKPFGAPPGLCLHTLLTASPTHTAPSPPSLPPSEALSPAPGKPFLTPPGRAGSPLSPQTQHPGLLLVKP